MIMRRTMNRISGSGMSVEPEVHDEHGDDDEEEKNDYEGVHVGHSLCV
jgi:hypothetical protein